MYGLFHVTIKDLVETQFGHDTWAEVLEISKLNEDRHFLIFKQYPDADLLTLVSAVGEILKVSMETVLKVVGGHFLTYCRQQGYDKILTTLGGDLITFIQNLDSLHSLLSVSYVGMVAPSFRCVTEDEGKLKLHYYSARKGFHPLVTGLLEAAGRELFQQTTTLTLESQTQEEIRDNKTVYHTVLQMRIEGAVGQGYSVDWAFGYSINSRPQSLSLLPSLTEAPDDQGEDFIIRVEDLGMALPFHILLDRQLCVRQCGESIRKLSPVTITDGTPLQAVGTIVQPAVRHTADNIIKFINSIFLLAIHRNTGQQPFLLKGQMIWLPYCRHLLFMGSPRLPLLDDFRNMKVYLSDIPLYDVTREVAVFNQKRIADIIVAMKLDEMTTALRETSKALQNEKRKTEELLYQMMPKKIARQLTSGQVVKAERYESCTVLFSDIVTFSDIVAKCRADDIVNMLNDMYHRFDTHTDSYAVYKVETIGDAYMAVTGVPEIQDDHAERMADFAMDMMEEAGNVLSPATGKPLKIRVGMHTGIVVAGVIGRKKPRYDIYGDTVNTASRMESNSVTGRIHVSDATYSKLYPHGYVFKARGQIAIKGKGVMETYFLIGTSGRSITEPDDQFNELQVVCHPDQSYSRRENVCTSVPVNSVEKISFVNVKKQSLKSSV